MMRGAGIYLHIPFCRKICHYCDFYKSRRLEWKPAFLLTLEREIAHRAPDWEGTEFTTVYFGGGTPSVLSAKEVAGILVVLQRHFSIVRNAEVTFEANPDDLSSGFLRDLRRAGVNRISIGVQALRNPLLRMMNRRHDAKAAGRAVKMAAEAGYTNISVDLIYGIPNLTVEEWEEELEEVLALPVQHLSAYLLTFEKGTVFGRWVERGKIVPPAEEIVVEQFHRLRKVTNEKGLLHYEISNFGKEGFFSRHNLLYWRGNPYVGLGPSAHSYNGKVRRWNLSDVQGYVKSGPREVPHEEEILSIEDRFNDRILTSLRTMWGIDLQQLAGEFPSSMIKGAEKALEKWLRTGHVEREGERYRLTEEGYLLSDRVISDCMVLSRPEGG